MENYVEFYKNFICLSTKFVKELEAMTVFNAVYTCSKSRYKK